YGKVLELNSEDTDAWYNMGVAHGKLGNHSQEIAYYQKALEIDPDHRFAKEKLEEALKKYKYFYTETEL
ncbi:MAG: tetratricopeptide repeat protein, partial [Promethearchaeota archaeon]